MSSTDKRGPLSADSTPGGETGEVSAHSYFRAVEEAFIRLRGAPFLLSPEDWRVAQGWQQDGIPVEVVERVLERILREREAAESGKSRRIRSLRYFDSAVSGAWKNFRAVGGSEEAREAPPMDVPERVSALADSIPTAVARAAGIEPEVRALRGSTEEVEARLAALDERMLQAARRLLDDERGRELKDRVEAGLARIEGRLPTEAVAEARVRLERQVLRRLLSLPLLSLFSPEARIKEG